MITGNFTEDYETLVPFQAFIANSHQLGNLRLSHLFSVLSEKVSSKA